MAVVKQSPLVRERTEELERASLSTWGTLAAESKGRDRYEDPDSLRTAFQQDRERLLGSPAFRRLAHQAQVLVRDGERHQSRLIHTLEVAQLAGTIARALRLNEDLAQAVALGHALGYGPFADACQEALSLWGAQRPAEQALRVVERLDRHGRGLNLTWEVRDGILSHAGNAVAATLEGQAARAADVVARLTSDLYLALRAGLLGVEELPERFVASAGTQRSRQVSAMVSDLVTTSFERPEVAFSQTMVDAQQALAELLRARVYDRPAAVAEHDRAVHCLRSLVVYHLEHPHALHGVLPADAIEVQVADFVSALTDDGARGLFERLFLPSSRPQDR